MEYTSEIFIVIFVIWFLLIPTGKTNENEENKPKDYTKLQLNQKELLGSRWALEQSQKIVVYHAFEIIDLVKVDTNDMSIRVDFHVKQRWEVDSLDFPKGLFKEGDSKSVYVTSDENVLQSVWSPDSFIPNARESKILSAAAVHSTVNIYKNKTIVYKARMYSILGCSFTFEWYPLDIQVCDLTFESHKYTTDVVVYEWEPNPVAVSEGIILYQYDLFVPPKRYEGHHFRWGGKFSYPYVKVALRFERKLGNNIIQVFTPTILIVTLSFFSFWLGLDAVPGRISLLITCILALITMHSGLKGTIPPVHYIKMMDVWMIGCLCFVFASFFEFVLVKYLKWRKQQIKNLEEEREKFLRNSGMLATPPNIPMHMAHGPAFHNEMNEMNNMNLPNALYPPPSNYIQRSNGKMKRSNPPVTHSAEKRQAWEEANQFGMPPYGEHPAMMNMHQVAIYDSHGIPPPTPPSNSRPLWVKIDRACRIVFPLLFIVFNAAYWPILLKGSAQQHLNHM